MKTYDTRAESHPAIDSIPTRAVGNDRRPSSALAGCGVLGAASAAARAWDYEPGHAEGLDADAGRAPQPPRVFLLDDDPIFCKLMEKVAKKNGIPITICSRLEEFGSKDAHREYDVAVIDYYLEDMKGPQIVELLDEHPVVMVSRNEGCVDEAQGEWPEAIKKFIPKRQGPQAILEAAITLSRPA